jgi:hypothetical protein
MRIRLLPGALIAAAAILLSACVPEFANPLAGGDAADPAVIGTWNAKAEGDDQAMLIDIKAAEGGIELVLRDPSSDGKDMTFKGSTAEVDGVRYANLTPVGPDVPEGTGYLIFRYALKDGTIQVWSLDEKAIEAAIAAGKLAGTTTGTGMDLASKITADSAAVAAFFATPEGQAAFRSGPEDVLTMTRVP